MKHTHRFYLLLFTLFAVLGAPGCEEYYTNTVEAEAGDTDEAEDERMFLGAYVGEDCKEDSECRDGLICEADQCVGGGTKQADAKCLLTIECDGAANPPSAPHGLHCGWAGFCVKSCVGCPWCGDSVCNGEETNTNCSADCASGERGSDCQDLSDTTADISLGAATGASCSADAGQEGSDCSTSSECARDFFCDMQGLSGFCTRTDIPAGKGDLGDTCDHTSECYLGLRCSKVSGTCVPGSILLYPDLFGGEDCSGSAIVEESLAFGVRMAIPEGDGDAACGESQSEVEAECMATSDCTQGDACCPADTPGAGTCQPDLDLCEEEPETVTCEAAPDQDFFSFPFPNDGAHVFHEDVVCGDAEGSFAECPRGTLRARAGTVNYEGFPVPGEGLIGFDPIGATVRALDGEMEGWSLLQATTLRFTQPVDEATLSGNVRIVNLETAETHLSVIKSEPIRNKFSCANRVFVQPLLSHPLEPDTHYAVIVTSGVRALSAVEGEQGAQAEALEGLPMLLSTAQPAAGVARDVWQSFEPLRLKIGQGDVPVAAAIAGATVFTTGAPTSVVYEIRALVDEREVPAISWSKKCEGTETPSRCGTPGFVGAADAVDPRGCQSPNQFYTEYHTQVEIPVIQTGTRPYIDLEADNALSGDLNHVNGQLKVVRTEKVCVAISIPNVCDLEGCTPGTPDTVNSHPVLLYGHGTGGTHRQGIALLGTELASPLKITTASGSDAELKERFVVVAWDQPMHHLRRFPEGAVENWNAATYTLTDQYVDEYTKEPGPLFYNFQNPRAARGNYMQAVADTFSLVKLLSQGSLAIDGDTPKIDDSRLSYHGHSQGGGNGPMVAPFEPGLDLMILSGTGGGTVDGILGKKLPYDSSIGCRIMLQELDVSRSHPGIQVLQHYFDAIDPSIYAPLLADPPSERGMNFMEVIGVRDSFTPPVSMAAYARGADLDLLSPSAGLPVWFDALEEGQSSYIALKNGDYVSGSLGANRVIDGADVTHVSVQHPPCPNDASCTDGVPGLPNFDGHFAIYQNTDALKEALSFLYSWADGGEATVTPHGSNAN